MRVALLSANALSGNAIGKQLAEKIAFFTERGAAVRVFLQSEQHDPDEVIDYLHDCDLVIADYAQWYPLLELLPGLANRKTRVLLDYHGVTPPSLWRERHQRRELEQSAARRGIVWCADAVVVHSESSRRELLHATRFPAESVYSIGYPVDFVAQPCTRSADRNPDSPTVLFVGRVAPNKGLPTLIDALARVQCDAPGLRLVIAGDASDVYAREMENCLDLANRLGFANRVQFLGQVSDARLAEAYQTADVFVMPSRHEGFCLPVIEAMAHGIPVIAARSTALPETVGAGGLTFAVDDAGDLAKQLRRVLLPPKPQPDARTPRRIAIVCFRFGRDIVGGAETSLRTMALALQQAGCSVEVFTTCTCSEDRWRNDLAAGTSNEMGLTIHRFAIDPHDRERHIESVRKIVDARGDVHADIEEDYLRHSIHSTALMAALTSRSNDFDAIITGPYLFGLTHDVAVAFPGKTLIAPCFHAEASARLKAWPIAYGNAAGLLYHSVEEQRFAEVELGVNHPNAVVVGTCLSLPASVRPLAPSTARYVLYCGRYSAEKNVPLLIEYARRYHAERGTGLRFVFVGQGNVRMPREPWLEDHGFVSEATRTELMAGAAALVQLSTQESLSLAALEAWASGVPVIAHGDCAVLAGHLARSGAGAVIRDYPSFAAMLDDLADNPEHWRGLGEKGQKYVREQYTSAAAFQQRLLMAIDKVRVPISALMRERGQERARTFSRGSWQTQFAAIMETVLEATPRAHRTAIQIEPQRQRCAVSGAGSTMLTPVRISNVGTQAALPEGPYRTRLLCQVYNADEPATDVAEVALTELLLPGESRAAMMPVPIPQHPGEYTVRFWCESATLSADSSAAGVMQLEVAEGELVDETPCHALLAEVNAALAEAHASSTLPDNYLDVTEGFLATFKRKLKAKLLGNFKHAYIDVLSRQQSDVNRQLVAAVRQLSACCETLDHAVQQLQQKCADLEKRLESQEVTAAPH